MLGFILAHYGFLRTLKCKVLYTVDARPRAPPERALVAILFPSSEAPRPRRTLHSTPLGVAALSTPVKAVASRSRPILPPPAGLRARGPLVVCMSSGDRRSFHGFDSPLSTEGRQWPTPGRRSTIRAHPRRPSAALRFPPAVARCFASRVARPR
jgi:hypothetical protein